jgi:DNA repair photolyase
MLSVPEIDLPFVNSAEIPLVFGGASITVSDSLSILTKASGFMKDYDFTLNPYSGCSYGCSYCYAAFFAKSAEQRDSWGKWVAVKQKAVEVLVKKGAALNGKRIYMSSVTDPYQPIEQKLELTRRIVEVLAQHQARLVVQTRSPVVQRDEDLFSRFEHIQINMTVTTDDDAVRKAFEPQCPSIPARLDAITKLATAGLPVCITMTPLLPVRDPEAFAKRLVETGVRRFVVQPFHLSGNSRFVRGTRESAVEIVRDMGWTPARYQETVLAVRRHLPHLDEGQAGFSSI